MQPPTKKARKNPDKPQGNPTYFPPEMIEHISGFGRGVNNLMLTSKKHFSDKETFDRLRTYHLDDRHSNKYLDKHFEWGNDFIWRDNDNTSFHHSIDLPLGGVTIKQNLFNLRERIISKIRNDYKNTVHEREGEVPIHSGLPEFLPRDEAIYTAIDYVKDDPDGFISRVVLKDVSDWGVDFTNRRLNNAIRAKVYRVENESESDYD